MKLHKKCSEGEAQSNSFTTGLSTPQQVHQLKGFKELLEGVPESQFCTKMYFSSDDRACATGHLYIKSTGYKLAGSSVVSNWALETGLTALNVPAVNDGYVAEYQQTTPKARVLQYFTDLLAEA